MMYQQQEHMGSKILPMVNQYSIESTREKKLMLVNYFMEVTTNCKGLG